MRESQGWNPIGKALVITNRMYPGIWELDNHLAGQTVHFPIIS